jgi:hypothetical protein
METLNVAMNDFLKSPLLEDTIPKIIGVVIATVPFAFAAWPISRRAKQIALFRQFANEIAVRDALFKLKLAASEPKTPQEALVKEAAYEKAQKLEEHLNKELEGLDPPPDKLWLQRASLKEVVFPARYEGQHNLSAIARSWWWILIIIALFCRLLSTAFLFLLPLVAFRLLFPHSPIAVFELLFQLVIYGLFFWYGSLMWRRWAYIVATRNPSPSPNALFP